MRILINHRLWIKKNKMEMIYPMKYEYHYLNISRNFDTDKTHYPKQMQNGYIKFKLWIVIDWLRNSERHFVLVCDIVIGDIWCSIQNIVNVNACERSTFFLSRIQVNHRDDHQVKYRLRFKPIIFTGTILNINAFHNFTSRWRNYVESACLFRLAEPKKKKTKNKRKPNKTKNIIVEWIRRLLLCVARMPFGDSIMIF